MRATIADIAKEAGVSKATVSRVLNERVEGVGAETRLRVKAVMERLEFEPCGVARGLATGKSLSVGLVVPDIADPFFPLLIRGIEDALRGEGYGLFLCDSGLDIEKEKESLRKLLEKRVDGVILNSTMSDCDCQLDLLDRRLVPYVLLDRMIEARPSAAGVYADNRKGARMAVEFLLGGGARRPLFINGPAELSVSKLRGAGVEEACRDGGLDLAALLRGEGDYSVESGERAVDSLLGSSGSKQGASRLPFDAVFAANDRMAIGALRALRRRGIGVPKEVEIVGFDDIEAAHLVEPPLTTVAQPAFEMGRESALLLLKLIEGKKPRKRAIVIEPVLVIRGTTRPRQ
jgi:LacI family transcriptional regulator